jgi:hypothetical protein
VRRLPAPVTRSASELGNAERRIATLAGLDFGVDGRQPRLELEGVFSQGRGEVVSLEHLVIEVTVQVDDVLPCAIINRVVQRGQTDILARRDGLPSSNKARRKLADAHTSRRLGFRPRERLETGRWRVTQINAQRGLIGLRPYLVDTRRQYTHRVIVLEREDIREVARTDVYGLPRKQEALALRVASYVP